MGSLKFKGRLAGLPSALGGRSSGMRPLQGHADVPGERGTHTRRASSPGHRALSAPSTADFQLTPMCNQGTSFHDSKNHVSPWTDTHINEKRSPEIQRAVTLTCPSPNKPSSLLSPDGPQPAPPPPSPLPWAGSTVCPPSLILPSQGPGENTPSACRTGLRLPQSQQSAGCRRKRTLGVLRTALRLPGHLLPLTLGR